MSALARFDISPFGHAPITSLAPSAPVLADETAHPSQQTGSKWEALAQIDIDRAAYANPRLVAGEQGKRAIPFDGLRTKLVSQCLAKGWKSVAVTSATVGTGKSTLVANLALAFARADTEKVLICDLNQRKPALASLFAVNPRYDISEVLFNDQEFAQQGHRLQTSVALAFSQQRQRGLFDTHRPQAIHEQIKQLADIYQPDLIIYDLPNIYEGDATFSFLSGVDCALAVARQDHCRISLLDECERNIAAQTSFAGFIVSQADG